MNPVVLVHGFLANQTLMLPMRRRLERAGHRVVGADLSPLCLQDVRRLARQLEVTVQRTRAETGAERVDVVGVSQGGVLALWWALHLGGFARVDRLVLVGAPVRGTWAAVAGLPALGLVSRGIWQLIPGSPLSRELVHDVPAGARVTTIAVAGDPVCPPERCSVSGGEHRVIAPPRAVGPFVHQWLALSRPVASAVVSALGSR